MVLLKKKKGADRYAREHMPTLRASEHFHLPTRESQCPEKMIN